MSNTGTTVMAGIFTVLKTCFRTVTFLFWLAVLVYAARFVFAHYVAEMADGEETVISIIASKAVFSLTFYARAFFRVLGMVFLLSLCMTVIDMVRQKSWQKSEEWVVLTSKCVVTLLASYLFLVAVTQEFHENGMPEIQGQSIQELFQTINNSVDSVD